MDDFNSITCPLTGCVFIEASAGTGKTHSITSLVLRLLLEEDADPAALLLVTYTNAATDELRRKTRERLTAAIRQLEGRAEDTESPGDPLISGLAEHQRIDPPTAARQLREALLRLDELSIFTIHGFCQRVLHDRAFESGQLFDTELEPDESAILREAALDFWRRQLPSRSELFFAYLETKHRRFDHLLSLARSALSQADATVLPPGDPSRGEPDEEALRSLVQEARERLSQEREDILQSIASASVNRRIYQEKRTRNWLEQLEDWLGQPYPLPQKGTQLERFTNEDLLAATQEGESPPRHPFFDLCDRLQDTAATVERVLERQWIQVKRTLLEDLRQRLPERKQQLNRYAYDDLLQNTLRALREDTTGLTASLATQYPWVLIDEFQDTDPTQYAIFQSLHACPDHSLLCLIGDPKQAIYAFRGGDIFTYTQARDRADHLATLRENWRSSPTLIRAVNTLYQAVPRPFGTASIAYHAVSAAQRPMGEAPALKGNDTQRAPLQIWQISGARDAAQLEQRCLEATGQEIARLIQLGNDGALHTGGRPLQASDIAILIRSHRQAAALQRHLHQRGIRTVSYDRQHLFTAPESDLFEILLQALAAPRDENLVKALLLSDLMGFAPTDLAAALADEGQWSAILESMTSYRAQWRSEGFMVMFRRFVRIHRLPRRILGLPGGERKLTNILHLSELIEEAEATRKLSLHATLQWFRRQRESTLSEEKELRLESDDERVKILTIHRSKGLEFPIVFLPFAWRGPSSCSQPDHVAFHRENDGDFARCVDVGSEDFDHHLARSREEEAEEELRMLYVALTRAQLGLYLLTAPESPVYRFSSIAYLWHHRQEDTQASLTEFHDRLKRLPSPQFREDLERLVGASGNSIGLRTWEGQPRSSASAAASIPRTSRTSETGSQSARRFPGPRRDQWGITSYSGLTGHGYGHGESLESPDRDPAPSLIDLSDNTASDLSGIAALPKGTRTGNMLHLLYEHLSFQADEAAIREAAAHHLAAQGMSVEEWLDVVTAHTLSLFRCDLGGFCLADVAPERRLNELAFHFPIERLTMAKLRAFFEQHELPAEVGAFDFHPVEGFLKGFIDLIVEHAGRYYVLDYKSNFLGRDAEDYRSSRLGAVMSASNYVLQYHLYAVALHRYLRYRLGNRYEGQKHWGGVRYLFVRGMSEASGPDYGVFQDRPPIDRVDALSDFLAGITKEENGHV